MLKTKHMQAHHFTDTNNKRGTGEVRGEGRGQVSGAAGERSLDDEQNRWGETNMQAEGKTEGRTLGRHKKGQNIKT